MDNIESRCWNIFRYWASRITPMFALFLYVNIIALYLDTHTSFNSLSVINGTLSELDIDVRLGTSLTSPVRVYHRHHAWCGMGLVGVGGS